MAPLRLAKSCDHKSRVAPGFSLTPGLQCIGRAVQLQLTTWTVWARLALSGVATPTRLSASPRRLQKPPNLFVGVHRIPPLFLFTGVMVAFFSVTIWKLPCTETPVASHPLKDEIRFVVMIYHPNKLSPAPKPTCPSCPSLRSCQLPAGRPSLHLTDTCCAPLLCQALFWVLETGL